MKKLTILICVLLFCGQANAQTDCSRYHKGFFMYTDSTGDTILIQRRNKYQYEYNRKLRIRTQFRINWNNDCEYVITQTRTNSKSGKKNNYTGSGLLITKADGDNGYFYNCSCKETAEKRKEAFVKKITKQEFYQLY